MFIPFQDLNTVGVLTLPWTSASDGTATVVSVPVSGTIVRITIIPGAGGLAPSAAYDMTLTDGDGLEILSTGGANLSATAATHFWGKINDADGNPMPATVHSSLTLAVTNAGDANSGTVKVFLKK